MVLLLKVSTTAPATTTIATTTTVSTCRVCSTCKEHIENVGNVSNKLTVPGSQVTTEQQAHDLQVILKYIKEKETKRQFEKEGPFLEFSRSDPAI